MSQQLSQKMATLFPVGELQRIGSYLGREIPEQETLTSARNVCGELKHPSDGVLWHKTPVVWSLEPLYDHLCDLAVLVPPDRADT